MSCTSDIRFTGAIALPLCLMLAACGEGTTNVASIPPPPPLPTPTQTPAPTPTPTPTPTPAFDIKTSWLDSPATRNGTYDLIGRLTLNSGHDRAVAPGEFKMSTDWYFGRESGDIPNYSLSTPSGILPGGAPGIVVNGPFLSWSFNPPQSYANEPRGSVCCQMLGQQWTVYSKAADGSETQILSNDLTRASTNKQPFGTNSNLQVTLDYDVGNSYVAMGEWSWAAMGVGTGDLLFVNGERTPASAIPTTGTATYDARRLGQPSSGAFPFSLTADFGQRSISTQISDTAFDVGGTAPFQNNGTFDIPLSGTAGSQTASGMMNGAFFGPHAEQVGGTFSLQNTDGVTLIKDAFVGQQRP